MKELHFPFIECAILVPLLGALFVARMKNPFEARKWSVVFTGIAFCCAVGAWQDFGWLQAAQAAGQEAIDAEDRWHVMTEIFGREIFVIDQLSAPLLPLAALLYFLTTFATLRTKIRRFSFSWMLVGEAILLATFSCKIPWGIVALLMLGTLPPYIEIRARGGSSRVFAIHMGLFIALLLFGWWRIEAEGTQGVPSLVAVLPLLAAVLIRSGVAPFHTWMVDLFDRATFGSALLFVTPMVGAYAAVRLVLPVASDEVLRAIGLISLVTAVYAAGMALVQREARRFFCYLFLSHSSLVLVGLEIVTPIGLTGALCVWLSIGVSLGGFGLTLRALESRRGRLSLVEFQGLYDHTPELAGCFVLTGLASVGFPGTAGFIGTELLVDGAVGVYPSIGLAVVVAAALNGIALVKAYFVLFTGTRYASSVSLAIGPREKLAVLSLAALIIVGGFIPQYNVRSRYHAAEDILTHRNALLTEPPLPEAWYDDVDDDDHDDDDKHDGVHRGDRAGPHGTIPKRD
ncbi:MAG: oxidoreductase [Planctomycetia bacterium]|nr:oxidoreductase [Planctomycetia bacterium]